MRTCLAGCAGTLEGESHRAILVSKSVRCGPGQREGLPESYRGGGQGSEKRRASKGTQGSWGRGRGTGERRRRATMQGIHTISTSPRKHRQRDAAFFRCGPYFSPCNPAVIAWPQNPVVYMLLLCPSRKWELSGTPLRAP